MLGASSSGPLGPTIGKDLSSAGSAKSQVPRTPRCGMPGTPNMLSFGIATNRHLRNSELTLQVQEQTKRISMKLFKFSCIRQGAVAAPKLRSSRFKTNRITPTSWQRLTSPHLSRRCSLFPTPWSHGHTSVHSTLITTRQLQNLEPGSAATRISPNSSTFMTTLDDAIAVRFD